MIKKGTKEEVVVPYAKSVHGEEEIAAVVEVLRSSTQMGERVEKLEEAVADLFDKRYGIAVNSGSSANYLAVEIANLPLGGEVITPALTFSTTVAPLVKNGLEPVFVDVNLRTFNVDVEEVESAIGTETVGLMIPSLIGNLPDWQALGSIAEKHDLVIIEDSADTLGGRIRGVSTGHWTDISTTSFYGSHIVNCAGNGGMLCVNDPETAEKARLLRGWGRASAVRGESEDHGKRFGMSVDGIPYDAKFVFAEMGYNYLPSEIGAAFGLVQLDSLDAAREKRQSIFSEHKDFFSEHSEYFITPEELPDSDTAWLAFPILIRADEAPFSRTELQIYLEKRGVQTRPVFAGNILRQPGFRHMDHRIASSTLENTDYIMKYGVLLGCHQGLSEGQVAYLYDTVDEFLEHR